MEIFRRHPAHVIVNLTVNEVEKEIAPGVRYTFWTFGGEVPGKFIRVRQGDVVELHLKNDPSSKMPHIFDGTSAAVVSCARSGWPSGVLVTSGCDDAGTTSMKSSGGVAALA